MEIVWRVSGRCLEVSERCLKGAQKVFGVIGYQYVVLEVVWRAFGACLEYVWRVSGGCLEGVWRVSGECLEAVSYMEIS